MENRFNLIDEPWIPVADHGRVSIKQIFSNSEYRSLGGNPVQKIALLKLLLAIAQAAATPRDDVEWQALGAQGLADRCLAYLEKWHDRFYLYGDKPFLQMPAIRAARVQPYGAVLPEVSTGNTTVLSQVQVQRELDDGSKALLLLTQMGFALSGKKTDNSVVLTSGYAGKSKSAKTGASVAHVWGAIHNFLYGKNILKTVWMNLLTQRQVEQINLYPKGIGQAPWEMMPEGEDCGRARELKGSLMGRLVPVCRFCLLADDGLHYSEGVTHPDYKAGGIDPSMAVNHSGKEPKVMFVDPEKRPWRELTALLGFFSQSDAQGFQSWQLRCGLDRACDAEDIFAIWSGGLRVSNNAGEQYPAGADDFVESQVWLHSEILGDTWFSQLKHEMDSLDSLSSELWKKVCSYFSSLKANSGKDINKTHAGKMASAAKHLFWQLCERDFQSLVDQCAQTEEAALQRQQLRKRFAGYIHQAYDKFCPHETARQLDAWAKCRPNNSKYLKQEA